MGSPDLYRWADGNEQLRVLQNRDRSTTRPALRSTPACSR